MERLKTTGACLASEFWFSCWIALSAVSIAGHFTGTLATYVVMFAKSLWRVLLLTIEMCLEALISVVRFLWAPKFWRKRRYEKSELPSPLFDVAVVATLIVFSVLANANL